MKGESRRTYALQIESLRAALVRIEEACDRISEFGEQPRFPDHVVPFILDPLARVEDELRGQLEGAEVRRVIRLEEEVQ